METPLYTHLIQYHDTQRVSFAMPGHKNGRGLPKNIMDCDVTELAATEDLHSPGKFIKRSLDLIRRIYGADESFILTGGSTAGIQSMISSALSPGDTLLSFADCHMSVINTCALLGIKLKFFSAKYDTDGHYAGFDEDILKSSLDGVSALIAVSPDYYGRTKDIIKLAEICHKKNIPLLVDQAHGAHFAVSDKFPPPACVLGADCTVMSAHKTLNALTGAAYLHVNGDIIDRRRIRRALSMFQSSSPSYPIAASAETAALTISTRDWETTIKRCENLKNNVPMRSLKNDDPTRLVFFTEDITGFEAEKILADKFGIDIEMADAQSVILIATPSNTDKDFDRLKDALTTIGSQSCHGGINGSHVHAMPVTPKGIVSPSDGFFADIEAVPLLQATGRIAACSVAAYPPGIPIICCGAPITLQMTDTISKLIRIGAKITGLESNNYIYVVKRL